MLTKSIQNLKNLTSLAFSYKITQVKNQLNRSDWGVQDFLHSGNYKFPD